MKVLEDDIYSDPIEVDEPIFDQTAGLNANDEARIQDQADAQKVKTDLRATALAFDYWMKRKKKEQEQLESAAERERKSRYSLMVEAMMDMRKSLLEVTHIELGERFSLDLNADDWLGWPRLTLRLKDKELPEADYPYFQIIAYDRKDLATLEIISGNPLRPEKVALKSDIDLKRLPLVFKRSARNYLDLVGEIVLEAEKTFSEDDFKINIPEQLEQGASQDNTQTEIKEEFFEELNVGDDYLEQLPVMEDIQALPTIKEELHKK